MQGIIYETYSRTITARLDQMVLDAVTRKKNREEMLDEDSDEMMDETETEHGRTARMALDETDMDWAHP